MEIYSVKKGGHTNFFGRVCSWNIIFEKIPVKWLCADFGYTVINKQVFYLTFLIGLMNVCWENCDFDDFIFIFII